jgi:hypothetical protein
MPLDLHHRQGRILQPALGDYWGLMWDTPKTSLRVR